MFLRCMAAAVGSAISFTVFAADVRVVHSEIEGCEKVKSHIKANYLGSGEWKPRDGVNNEYYSPYSAIRSFKFKLADGTRIKKLSPYYFDVDNDGINEPVILSTWHKSNSAASNNVLVIENHQFDADLKADDLAIFLRDKMQWKREGVDDKEYLFPSGPDNVIDVSDKSKDPADKEKLWMGSFGIRPIRVDDRNYLFVQGTYPEASQNLMIIFSVDNSLRNKVVTPVCIFNYTSN